MITFMPNHIAFVSQQSLLKLDTATYLGIYRMHAYAVYALQIRNVVYSSLIAS